LIRQRLHLLQVAASLCNPRIDHRAAIPRSAPRARCIHAVTA
jgi:hypothetical protein